MSIVVDIHDLAGALTGRPWGYLLTVGPDLRAHAVAVPTMLDDGLLMMTAGRRTAQNAAERPEVTLVFPPPETGGMSLIVDGTAAVDDGRVVVTPVGAVLHRAALP